MLTARGQDVNGGGGKGGVNGGRGKEWGHEAGGACGVWPLPCPPLGPL